MSKLSAVEPISFTRQVKEEITTTPLIDRLQKRALLSGFIKINSKLIVRSNGWIISIKSENIKTAKLIISLLKELYDVDAKISISEQKRFKKNNINKIVHIEILTQAKLILEDLQIYSIEDAFNTLPSFITNDLELVKCYLRGCFLASGSVNSPETKFYHFEISSENVSLGQFIIKLLKKFNISAKRIDRRNNDIVYVKRSDQIGDILRILGAFNSLLYFEDVRIQRDQLNSMNRVVNCEVSNEKKAMEKGNEQADLIRWYKETYGFSGLDSRLKIVAELRLAAPDAAYNELVEDCASLFNVKLTKSGISYRMNKLIELIKRVR